MNQKFATWELGLLRQDTNMMWPILGIQEVANAKDLLQWEHLLHQQKGWPRKTPSC